MQDTLPTGLTAQEVKTSRRIHGVNSEEYHNFTLLKSVCKSIFSIFNIIMAILIIALFLVNQSSTAEVIGIIAMINTVIEIVQQARARAIINSLRTMTKKTAKVMRDGEQTEILVRDLVIGDVIHLSAGDSVPVDGTLYKDVSGEFDESILTGESNYILKKTGDEIQAGSFLVSGGCYYTMKKLSKNSYIQSVARKVTSESIAPSPLQSEIGSIINVLTYVTLFFIVLLIVEGITQELTKQEIVLNVATIISSLVPQGLVLISTISFAYSALKIAKHHAIVQKLSAIEAVANTQVICIDKTGTLTENRLSVERILWE